MAINPYPDEVYRDIHKWIGRHIDDYKLDDLIVVWTWSEIGLPAQVPARYLGIDRIREEEVGHVFFYPGRFPLHLTVDCFLTREELFDQGIQEAKNGITSCKSAITWLKDRDFWANHLAKYEERLAWLEANRCSPPAGERRAR
jgi:hypothetical protein